MRTTQAFMALGILVAVPTVAMAQGTVRGAEEGVNAGDRAAGPVGGVVGGAVGAATGTVGGVLGVGPRGGCDSKTVTREDSAGNAETVRRSNCN